jgi:hypothetical protein
MSDQDYATSFTVDQTPEEAFAAITNPRGWWSEGIQGGTAKAGDEFTYQYEDIHRCKIKLTEVVPDEKVVWFVEENYFNFTEDKTEWTGTEITFEVAQKGDKTEVSFTHLGLVPEYECFDICSNSWGSYVNGSLKSLITMGAGQPNEK